VGNNKENIICVIMFTLLFPTLTLTLLICFLYYSLIYGVGVGGIIKNTYEGEGEDARNNRENILHK
jgi:hypothetical protein